MGLFQGIFGGSKSKSESGNKAYPWAMDTFGKGAGQGFSTGLGNIMGILTGQDGGAALDNWWKSSGGDFLLNQGTDAINANMYARGLGNSGADMKALENYRSDLASTKLNEVLQNFFGLSDLGLKAGSLVTDAGQYSKGKSTSQTGNFGKFLGALL